MGFNKELKTLSIKQKLAMHYVSKESKLTRVGERYGETMDVHGAGAQRSDPKTNQSSGKASNFVERLDQDGDSRVSGSEFHGPPAHFNHFDSNRDGYITQNEAPKGSTSQRSRPLKHARTYKYVDFFTVFHIKDWV